ncbi:MAG TPA: glycosyltransferase, partial [Polyangiales bacterium]|nr:glycosyltransferase [Polyangiales bacterium]
MADILMVSKPIVPPWHDSSKNLVRDLAGNMQRHVPVVLSKRGYERRLPFPRARVEGVYPARSGGFAPALVDNARVLLRLVAGSHADLWHFFFAPNPRTSSVASRAASLRRVRTLQTVCSAPRDDVDPKRVLFADRVVVLSRHTERRFLSAGIAASTLRLIRPSIAPLAAPSAEDRRGMRERLGWPADAPIVVYAGDFEFGRGAALAIEAHSALPRELGAWLVMACRTKTPAARARELELKQLAEQLGCMSSMRWLGETPRIHEVLAAADVVTLPTDTLYAKMDLPLVLVEAMALERPVLIG